MATNLKHKDIDSLGLYSGGHLATGIYLYLESITSYKSLITNY